MNDQQKQQVLEQVKSASHVLVTVSTNPTVDELAASIGLTLALNKMDKHATTVFSGVVPSTIEFLQPEKTIETTTDSLRDFIIALDKSKADKLRYKVEDDIVRIFITPYRTSISDKDLEFSQGDFNVDVVIALGVTRKQDLDTVIVEHGRILHDATILALTNRDTVSDLGAVNWQDTKASSLCEMVATIVTEIKPDVLDGQMATAFLTGIIAETDRFKNDRTTPIALSLSSKLMSAGANQQLIAEKLDSPEAAPEAISEYSLEEQSEASHGSDGELEISHADEQIDNINIDDDGNLDIEEVFATDDQPVLPEPVAEDMPENAVEEPQETSDYVSPQPQQSSDPGRTLFEDLLATDNSDHGNEPTLKQPNSSATPMMQHQRVIAPPVRPGEPVKSDKPFDLQEAMQATGAPQQILPSSPQSGPAFASPTPVDSLANLEVSVDSPHVAATSSEAFTPPADYLDTARDSVNQAIVSQPPLFPTPTQAMGAQPMNLEPPTVEQTDKEEDKKDPNAPPSAPPPMTPQFYDAEGNNANPFLNPQQ